MSTDPWPIGFFARGTPLREPAQFEEINMAFDLHYQSWVGTSEFPQLQLGMSRTRTSDFELTLKEGHDQDDTRISIYLPPNEAWDLAVTILQRLKNQGYLDDFSTSIHPT